MKVGFVGVGAMGAAMAGHAAAAGHEVLAVDTDSAAQAAAATGGVREGSPDDIARDCEAAVVVVNTDDQTAAVVRDLIDRGAGEGFTFVVAATNHPRTMIALAAEARTRGAGFVDAPVVFGLQGARRGELVTLCGGSEADVACVRPVLDTYSKSVEHLGPVGTGQLGKACNNMMHWAHCVANYETLLLAKACGLDAQAMRETLLKCPARNGTLERWDNSKFTWHEKDMDVVLDLSQEAGLALPLFGAVDQLVKRIGPADVARLLHGEGADYLGDEIAARPLDEIFPDRPASG